MALLLDTCAILFYSFDAGRLSRNTYSRIESETIIVSAVSIGEIACAYEKKRISLNEHWLKWWRQNMERSKWTCVPVTPEIMQEAYSLAEPIHADPADRILIATTRLGGYELVTTDERILRYPHVRSIS
jgi:PIN domain nuclease of toxin-antitoxin system